MNPRRYFFATLTSSLILVAAIFGLAWWLEPISGDLTRIGSYAERDYGWNLAQERFEPLLHHFGAYDRRYDMVVIGDSFANSGGGSQWQNFVANRTGWSILTLDVHKTTIRDLLATPAFRLIPPNVVILNVVERDLDEFEADTTECSVGVLTSQHSALPLHPIAATPNRRERLGPMQWADTNPGFARRYLWNNILRRTLGLDTTDVIKLPMHRHDFFSSRRADEILVYRIDARKAAWDSDRIARIRCGMVDIEKRFVAAGVRQFVLAIAPDKSSAYRPWLKDPAQVVPSRIPEIRRGLKIAEAPLDLRLGHAIADGAKDIYLPNDTHWGSAGHKLVAEAILDTVTKSPFGKPADGED